MNLLILEIEKREIDQLVYKLYGLSEEELRLVDSIK